MLSPKQIRHRDGRVTASFAPYLMAGNEAKVLAKWRELVGDPEYVPEDLSEVWPVQFGSFIEPFALDWHQRTTGRALTRRGDSVTHPTLTHVSCTLDAFRPDDECVIDCKAIGAYRKLEDVGSFYTAQMVVQAACVGAKRAALLIVHGGAAPIEYEVELALPYIREVFDRIAWFWDCVESLNPPSALPASAPVPVAKWRTIDLDANDMSMWPNWAFDMQSHIASWSDSCAAARNNASAAKSIKDTLPDDVGKLTYSGVVVTRAKNGAVSIKEAK